MKSTLNSACVSALLCGVIIIATPALAQLGTSAGASVSTPGSVVNTGASNSSTLRTTNGSVSTTGRIGTPINPGASVSTGVSVNGDVNNADASGNAASVNRATQTPAQRMSRRTKAAASAVEAEPTRQLNSQATLNAKGTVSGAVQ